MNDISNGNCTVWEEFNAEECYMVHGESARGPRSVLLMTARRVHAPSRWGDEEHSKPVWVALGYSDPKLSTNNEHYQHINIQYFFLVSKNVNVLNTYEGWDCCGRNYSRWKADSTQPSCRIHIDSILTAWKLRARAQTVSILRAQAAFAKDNLLRCFDIEEESDTL